jgi:RND family efflux transporter MFP subunit
MFSYRTLRSRPFTLSWACALGAAMLGCGGPPAPGTATGAAAPGGSAPALAASAPSVGVSTVRAQTRDVPVQVMTTGTVTSLSTVDVRPQTTSVVTRVHIREGQFVRAGELLFTLDSRVDEANLAKARAQRAKDEAALADARRQLERSRELLAQNFVSQGAVDVNQTLVASQSAAVAADLAAVDAAQVAVSYGRVVAPAPGRVGSIAVYAGSGVQANQTSLLTITQLDPIAVAFSLPQRHLADALAALKDGGAPVTATLPEGAGVVQGRLQFVDSAVDAASGTVKVKAKFDNGPGTLWPGAFVNVAMTVRTLKDAVVVPQACIIQSARGTLVYVVKDGLAAPRPVQLIHAQGEDAVVSGLQGGEAVVLDGRQNLRPGSAVVERPREGTARAAGPGASAASRRATEAGRGASDAASGGRAGGP